MSVCNVIVAHNGNGFDLPFIAAELLRIGSPVPNVQSVDTMLDGRWATPNGKYPNLEELCFAMDVPYDQKLAHSAEYDVNVMLDCFFKALKMGFYKLPVVEEVVC
jgi:DNA polymerase-3 subunit epsilon